MKEEIFRKKSLDKVKSPENLEDYIRVANPGVWLLLISVIVLLIGACVWGVFGHIDSTLPSTVCVENGSAVCYVEEKDISSVSVGLTVKFADQEAVISRVGELDEMGYACTLASDSVPSDGYYEGKIVTQSYQPLSFILN